MKQRTRMAVACLALLGAFPSLGIASGGVRSISEIGVTAKVDSTAGAAVLEVSLNGFTLPAGAILTCADLQLRVPAAAGKEIELWPTVSTTEWPWAASGSREARKSRRLGFVSEEGHGFVRFDLTDLLQGWSVKEREAPIFYLRLRGDEELEGLTPRAVLGSELLLHTMVVRTR